MSRTGSGRKLMAASSCGLDPSSMTFLKQRGDSTRVCSFFLPPGNGAGQAAIKQTLIMLLEVELRIVAKHVTRWPRLAHR